MLHQVPAPSNPSPVGDRLTTVRLTASARAAPLISRAARALATGAAALTACVCLSACDAEAGLDSSGISASDVEESWSDEELSAIDLGETSQSLVSGDRPLLVVLLEKPGTPFAHDQEWYRRRFFGPGRNIRSYFWAASKNQFRFREAGIVSVRDDESLDSVVGATSADSETARKRKRARYLAGRAGFRYGDYDTNRDGKIQNEELAIIAVDTYSDNGGQYGSPACTAVSGLSVCSGVALAGHRGSLMLWAHELSHSLGTDDLYGSGGKSLHLTPMSSTGGIETTSARFFDPWHRKKLGWSDFERVVTHSAGAGRSYTLDYQNPSPATSLTTQWLTVTTPRDPSGTQEAITFEVRGGGMNAYDDEASFGLYAWYSELDAAGSWVNWPGGDRSIFTIAPIEGCSLHAGDARSIGRGVPLVAPGKYAWYWAGGVITFSIGYEWVGTSHRYKVSWALADQQRSCDRTGVTVYEHSNFGGARQEFEVGTWDHNAMNIFGNDQISSLIVDQGYKVRVCDNSDGSGACQEYRGVNINSVSSVGALNDKVSYVEVIPDRFVFSNAGEVAGYRCVSVDEADDPHTWQDNYFCSSRDEGMQWSSGGPIAGMSCVQILEESDPYTWADNYLCFPSSQHTSGMVWSSGGPIVGKSCVSWNEPSDPDTWTDNYLCY